MRNETRIRPTISRAWPLLATSLTLSLAMPLQAQTSASSKTSKTKKTTTKKTTKKVLATQTKKPDPLHDGKLWNLLTTAFTKAQSKKKEADTTNTQVETDLKALKVGDNGLPIGDAGLTAIKAMTDAINDVTMKNLQAKLLTLAQDVTATHKALQDAYTPFNSLDKTQIAKLPNEVQTAVNGAHPLIIELDASMDDTVAKKITTDSDTLENALAGVAFAVGVYVGKESRIVSTMDLGYKPVPSTGQPVKPVLAPMGKQYYPPVTAEVARGLLAAHESDLADMMALFPKIDDQMKALQKALNALNQKRDALNQRKPKPKPAYQHVILPKNPLGELQRYLHDDLDELNDWLTLIAVNAMSADTNSSTTFQNLVNNPGKNRVEAKAQVALDLQITADLSKIITQTGRVLSVLEDSANPLVSLKPLPDTIEVSHRLEALKKENARIGALIVDLQNGVPIDLTDWESYSFSLYYFDDVARLMQVLCKDAKLEGGDKAARQADDTLRQQLDAQTQAQADAQARLNYARILLATQQQKIDASLADAKDALQKAAAQSNQTAATLQAATQQKNVSAANLTAVASRRDLAKIARDNAKTALAADPTNPKLQADAQTTQQQLDVLEPQVIAAKQNDDVLAGKLTAAQTADTAAQKKTASAQATVGGLQDETKGLAKKAKDAEDALTKETANTRDMIGKAILLANKENTAFAAARDNAPYWANRPDLIKGPNSDPLQRVMLFGFPDSKTIFIRGNKDDVGAVVEMLAKFDRPQAQTLMTLWSMEINSDSSPRGYDTAMKALQLLREAVESARIETDTSLDLLRECINKEVASSASDDWVKHLKRMIYPSAPKEIWDQLLYAPPDELGPLAFYDPKVLYQFGWREDYSLDHNSRLFLSTLLPNPSAPTTLAEALMILSLTTPPHRQNIAQRFFKEVGKCLEDSLCEAFPKPKGSKPDVNATFTNLKRFIGVAPQCDSSSDQKESKEKFAPAAKASGGKSGASQAQSTAGTTSTNSSPPAGADIDSLQRELVSYLQNREIQSTVDYMKRYSENLAIRYEGLQTLQALRKLLPSTSDPNLEDEWPEVKKLNELAVKNALIKHLMQEKRYRNPVNVDSAIYALDFDRYSDANPFVVAWLGKQFANNLGPSDPKAWQQFPEKMKEKLQTLQQVTHGKHLNAREAALNEMLKTYVRDIDDDLKRQFIEPMFEQVRLDMMKKAHVGVGIIQRTTVLGANRLVARVDPSASGALPMGETQNALQAALQLGQLAAAAETGGALTVLNGLDRLPKEAPKGVYGVTNGNVFQVTPVVDPSGQAMRFRFDYVLSSPIREPNGVTDPQLSHIDRHGVNTEVQLSNMEIRLISQYEANTQLGLPPSKGGGIPLLKDLPVLKDLPLIGWFTVRKGRSALVQQSLLLGQTTIFPTIGDICDLLIRPTVLPDPDLAVAEPEWVDSVSNSAR